MGDTTVLVTVVGKKEAEAGRDFFPLTVNYQEKSYAAGKIPGGFFKREGRPSEDETLIARLIDRQFVLFSPMVSPTKFKLSSLWYLSIHKSSRILFR